jgi:carboxyl-terminal processing protease
MAFNKSNRQSVIIFLLSIVTVLALLTTFLVAQDNSELRTQLNKFQLVLKYTHGNYVDDVDWEDAMTGAITGMLGKLDPHSVYINKKVAKSNAESFSGNYEGIGIQFDVIDGYITVVAPFLGSPAFKVGLESGDKIVKIDGENSVGIERDDVPKKLKGPKGTVVNVSVMRAGVNELLEMEIIRDAISIPSVNSVFMWDDETGYIQLNRFMATTGIEIEEALYQLAAEGMERLVLDLRGNPGGYLNEAVKVAGKFLPGRQLIVYTQDRQGNVVQKLFSDTFSREKTRQVPLIVMIDKSSASASEIVSGALQDHDRALVVGENSFGKGLVQREFDLQDGSKLRLSWAKYFIPSQRFIQKPYKGKNKIDYYSEEAIADSTVADSLHRPVHYTLRKNRKVYGGGGIYPDVEINDGLYAKNSKMIIKMNSKRTFFEFARKLVDEDRIDGDSPPELIHQFELDDKLLEEYRDYCETKEITEFAMADFQADREFIKIRLLTEIARTKLGIDQMWEVLHRLDSDIVSAMAHFDAAEALIDDFPFAE